MPFKIFIFCVYILGNGYGAFSQVSTLLSDINPGSKSSFVNGRNLYINYKESLIFAARNESVGHEVFIYKDKQVKLLRDINPGTEGSEAQNFHLLYDKVIFTAKTKANGVELWTSDGTPNGTTLLADIAPGTIDGVLVNSASYNSLLVFNNKFYFTSFNGSNFLMWETDGTLQGTKPVKNMDLNHQLPSNLTIYKNELYFTSTFRGLYKIENETGNVKNIISGLSVYNLLATEKYLYCIDSETLWISEGSAEKSKKIFDISSPTYNTQENRLVQVGQFVYFPNFTKETGAELWKTDGTTAGTKIVKDAIPGSDGYPPQNYTVFKGKLFYKGENENSGIELFVSDGTEQGTTIVKDINPGAFSSFSLPTELISDSKRIYFNAASFFTDQLWISDGTTAGTRKIKVSKDLENDDDPRSFYLFENKLIVFAYSDELGYEPYMVDFIDNPLDLDKDGFFGSEDCDETNPNINAGRTEIPYNGIDDDCNSNTPDDDIDKDGFKRDKDCNDNDAEINPNKGEILYNGIDDDCDPKTVDDDYDGDGFLKKDDCDDNNKNINPKAKEILGNNIDENCDGKDDPLLGLFENENSVIAFPNPSFGEFELENAKINTLKIFNVNGQVVTYFLKNKKIKLLDKAAGTYFVKGKTESENKPFAIKIIVIEP